MEANKTHKKTHILAFRLNVSLFMDKLNTPHWQRHKEGTSGITLVGKSVEKHFKQAQLFPLKFARKFPDPPGY